MLKPVLAAVVAASMFAAYAQAATSTIPTYQTTVLQTLQSGDTISAYSLNDQGVTTGFSGSPQSSERKNGVTWGIDGTPTLLPLPSAYPRSTGTAINNQGDVLGWGQNAKGKRFDFVVRDGVAHEFDKQLSGFEGAAMNDAGQIAGTSNKGSKVGVLDADGAFHKLDVPKGGTVSQLSINNDGTVVGTVTITTKGKGKTSVTTSEVAMWHDGSLTVLNNAKALDIDNHGQVLVSLSSGAGQALWDGTHLTNVAPGALGGSVVKMNDLGDMVGSISSGASAFARIGGRDVALDDLLDPTLLAAGWKTFGHLLDINNRGQILADAWNPSTHQYSAVRLTPVPEPAPLVLSGVGVVAMLLRRRRPDADQRRN